MASPNYAWLVSVAGFLGQFVLNFAKTVLGISIVYIAESFGVAAAALAVVSSTMGTCQGLFGSFWGWLSDKIGLRKSISTASFMVALSLILFGLLARNVASAVLIYAIIGFAISGLSTATAPKLVSTWFHPSMRGKGQAIISVGAQTAGILIGALAPQLIVNFTWQGCYIILGIICAVLSVFITVVLRDSPASLNTVPCGSPEGTPVGLMEKAVEHREKLDKRRVLRVLKMPITWKFAVIFIVWQFWLMGYTTYEVAAFVGMGFSIVTAGLAYSCMRAGTFVGQLIFTSLTDYVPRKYVFGGVAIVGGLLMGSYTFVFDGANPDWFFFGYCAFAGLFMSSTPIMQTSLAELYPVELRGTGAGVQTTISIVGRYLGPILAALVMTTIGNDYLFIFTGGSYLVAGLLVLLLLPVTGGKKGDPLAEMAIKELDEKEQ